MINKTIKYRCYISKGTYTARIIKKVDDRIYQVNLVSKSGDLKDLPLRYIDTNQIVEIIEDGKL